MYISTNCLALTISHSNETISQSLTCLALTTVCTYQQLASHVFSNDVPPSQFSALLRNMLRSDVAFKTRSRAQDPSFSPLLAQTDSTLRSTKSMHRMKGVREEGVGVEERRNNKTLAWQNSHKSRYFLRAPHVYCCGVSCVFGLARCRAASPIDYDSFQ